MNNHIKKELLSDFSDDIGTVRVRTFSVRDDGAIDECKGFYSDDLIEITMDSCGEYVCSEETKIFLIQLNEMGYGLDLYRGVDFYIHPNQTIKSRRIA